MRQNPPQPVSSASKSHRPQYFYSAKKFDIDDCGQLLSEHNRMPVVEINRNFLVTPQVDENITIDSDEETCLKQKNERVRSSIVSSSKSDFAYTGSKPKPPNI